MNEIRVQSDILIIGGGIAGLTVAIRIKEIAPETDVLIAEKQVTGWSGKANKGYGAFSYFGPEDDPEEFVKYQVSTIGCGITNQKRSLEWARTANHVVEKMIEWGCEFARTPDGELDIYKPAKGIPHSRVGAELNITDKLRRKAEKEGVRFINKVMVVRLLKKDNRVNGAVGFSLLDGTYHIFEAKAVVLANGGQNYRTIPMWTSGRGDGIIAAYEAGAQLRGGEFGSFALTAAGHRLLFCAEDFMINALGEDITAKYKPELQHYPGAAGTLVVDMVGTAVSGWYKEWAEGRGPVYCDTSKFGAWASWKRPLHDRFKELQAQDGAYIAKQKGMETDVNPLVEITPINLGEYGPVKVDDDFATTVDGLYAIGDICSEGTCIGGAVPIPPGRLRGSGLSIASFGGLRVSEPVVSYIKKVENAGLDEKQIENWKTYIYAPLDKKDGEDPVQILKEAQELATLVKYSGYKEDSRLKEVLEKLAQLKPRSANVYAKDWHYLAMAHELYTMVVCEELFYTACQVRKESRGWFIREDYPHTDNENWLKWIDIVMDEDGRPSISTENVPIEEYPVQLKDVYDRVDINNWF